EGDTIKRGQTLITFDKAFIENKGFPTITPVIVTNADDYEAIELDSAGSIDFLGKLINLKKKA
ncbi:MAG: PTS glucose transporter subunit IIA, partial [Clostridia bacterium]|nr:PTS glucose transporter subunit IIA [Clostridia bacterium]